MVKKTPSILEIEKFCNKILKPEKFQDYAFNGIQIETEQKIKKIVSGVTLSQKLIEKAVKNKADMILTHHGFQFGEQLFTLRSYRFQRIKTLIEKQIGLIAYHLPLDAHLKIGNNANLAKILKLKKIENFDVGVIGELDKEKSAKEIVEIFKNSGINTTGFSQNKKSVKRILIISGGGNSFIKDEKMFFEKPPFDLFITGDFSEHRAEEGKEKGYDYIALGHDASEKSGVQNLGKMIAEKFKINHEFIEI